VCIKPSLGEKLSTYPHFGFGFPQSYPLIYEGFEQKQNP